MISTHAVASVTHLTAGILVPHLAYLRSIDVVSAFDSFHEHNQLVGVNTAAARGVHQLKDLFGLLVAEAQIAQ